MQATAMQYVAKRVLIPIAELWRDINSKPCNSIETGTQKMKNIIIIIIIKRKNFILVRTLTILTNSEMRTSKDQLKRQQRKLYLYQAPKRMKYVVNHINITIRSTTIYNPIVVQRIVNSKINTHTHTEASSSLLWNGNGCMEPDLSN